METSLPVIPPGAIELDQPNRATQFADAVRATSAYSMLVRRRPDLVSVETIAGSC